ncbi:MocR-like transcription factor YczR [Pseudonocardia hydrocarbonoxydans]|uniref:GntR family transcriptional regulator n=1 Tax=Pseudonocardia hydrocarbonoxydans TaxID=76726 RepID=A0A4Y3WP46_9PSEU|nr:PLP-dependent aminotransferase family protein [Pseudonocardia hydrocarbonoxydans]GEC20298.1 GntR family transcriptional regulator [Pseudonocardia hydrocarbonoxydans]
MEALDRRIGARSFARLLGDWRPPDGRGLAGALADRVRLLVLDGRLPLQTRVPAERELAGALGVSRTTVAAAYDALRDAAVLHSRRGSGSWTRLPADRAGTVAPSPFSPHGDRALFDLAHAALPAPSEELRAAAAGALHDLDGLLGGHGYDLLGLPELRAAVARRYTERGLPTNPDQVLVTAGAQQAIALALAGFTGPGDRVLVEQPTYPNALEAITARGARPVGLPLSDGWDLDLVAAALRDAAPRLAYVIPDFQNPTGAVLDPGGRARLVELARRTGTPLVLDETLSELWLDGPVPPPAASFGAAEAAGVLTLGSASKVFWGGLRVGWIRGTAPTVRRLAALRAAVDLGSPALEQLLTARLVHDLPAVTAGRRAALVTARDGLRAALATRFPAWRPSAPTGGLSFWIDLGDPVSSRLTVAARRHDVLLAAGPRFGIDGAFERYLRLPWTLRPDRVDEALDRLATAWNTLDHLDAGVRPDPVAVA